MSLARLDFTLERKAGGAWSVISKRGQLIPVTTELTSITGSTSNGRDASAIVATTATGAVIGSAADWGRGAAIGAGAGLVAYAPAGRS